MNLYVVRHGETNNNKENRFNGQNDQSLNNTGIEQAKITAQKVRELDIDLIICSPLVRTKQTLDIINVNNIPVIFEERIMERDTGDYVGKLISDVDMSDWYEINPTIKYPTAESIKDLYTRASKILDEIKMKYDNKNILLVTHGDFIKMIKAYVNGVPEDGNFEVIEAKNCEILKYKI